jgi:hypothetical protein
VRLKSSTTRCASWAPRLTVIDVPPFRKWAGTIYDRDDCVGRDRVELMNDCNVPDSREAKS